jgi:hypothetical protein
MWIAQQGDVLLKRIDELPKKLKTINGNILAEGEHTGNFHALVLKGHCLSKQESIPQLRFYEGENKERFVEILDFMDLLHQEHKSISVPPGIYKVDIVREYDHFDEEARKVID